MLTIEEKRALYMGSYEKNKEYVDKRVSEGIEANRKGDCKVRFADENGKPLAGKKVKINQKTHDFKYGANIFLLDEFPDEADNEAYRSEFKKYFNLATVPFYWCDLEPERGKPRYAKDSPKVYRRPAPDLCIEYCEENGITPKLHCLVYDHFRPKWMDGLSEDEMLALYEKRFSEIAERYTGKFFEMEVINEQFSVNRLKTEFLRTPTAVKDMFALARKHFPKEKLTINEGNPMMDVAKNLWYGRYYLQCESLLAQGVSIDRIGMQHHLFVGTGVEMDCDYDGDIRAYTYFSDPMMFYRALDRMGSLGKPLEITEVTIPTFGKTEGDEQLQADMLRMWYSVWFSHPAVDCVVYWNTVEGMTYDIPGWHENTGRGGLWHRDMTPKKSALTLKKLFNEEWHTDLELTTDENGYVTFRGFYGDYTADIGGSKFEFGIHKDNDNTYML